MTFSEKLVRLRKLKGVTQDQFANVIGVSRQAVFKWESGQSYPEALKLLAIRNFFAENVQTVDQLIDDECEIVFPEKPKRRRRAAKVEQPAAAPVVEETPVAEEVTAVEETPAAAPEVKEEVKAEPTAAPKAEDPAKPQKKKGFWGRLFGR